MAPPSSGYWIRTFDFKGESIFYNIGQKEWIEVLELLQKALIESSIERSLADRMVKRGAKLLNLVFQ